ncbi:MAG TPA: hypothetical protein DCW64_06635 [Lactococcus lactis]|nr:hypothetical protein [Lactococcus lactis]
MHVFVLCLNYTIVTLRFKDNIKCYGCKITKKSWRKLGFFMKIYMMTKEFTRVSEEKDDRGM